MLCVLALVPPSWLLSNSVINGIAVAPTTSGPIQETKKEVITQKPRLSIKTYTESELQEFLLEKFTEYGIQDQYDKAVITVYCESGWRVDPAHNGVSLGIAQFTKATWDDYGVGEYTAIDPYKQLSAMAYMWSIGLASRWDCYRMNF